MKIQSINPATEIPNKEVEIFSKDKVEKITQQLHHAFLDWKKLTLSDRILHLKKIAATLRNKKEEYAKLITQEMGKPISQSLAEIEKCAWTVEIFSEKAPTWLQDEKIKTEAKKSFVSYEPLGIILAIMPWNYPFWQLFRCAIPALLAGNVLLLRHSNVVPLCALAMEEIFNSMAFSKKVLKTIITDHALVNDLIKSKIINAVSMTGSVAIGKKIGMQAGGSVKKVVLELGGSDPFIILGDADLEKAAQGALEGRLLNSGQSCIAAKRFIVVKECAEKFIKLFKDKMQTVKIGDPFDKNTLLGPLAHKEQLAILAKQIKDSVELGAKIEIGGKKLFAKGYFFAPTLLTAVQKEMPIWNEEVFGPVAPIMIVEDEKEAIQLANESALGLGSSIWTQNLEKGEQIARCIESGIVAVNSIVKSDPRLPFGGIKESGIGRELSRHGLLEFTNIKSIIIN